MFLLWVLFPPTQAVEHRDMCAYAVSLPIESQEKELALGATMKYEDGKIEIKNNSPRTIYVGEQEISVRTGFNFGIKECNQ